MTTKSDTPISTTTRGGAIAALVVAVAATGPAHATVIDFANQSGSEPEPGTYVLVGLGFGIVSLLGRRRRRKG